MTSTAETFRDFGGKDSEPCHDCGTPLYLDSACCAIDSALVCMPCGLRRYGADADRYMVVWPTCPSCGQPANTGFHAADWDTLQNCPDWVADRLNKLPR